MRSERNSYSGRRKVETKATINSKKVRATQKAKQVNPVETVYESVTGQPQTSKSETEHQGCLSMLGTFSLHSLFSAMSAWLVYVNLTWDIDDLYDQIWRDWRFIVPFLVFSFLVFLGLKNSRLKFLLCFPSTVLVILIIRGFWWTSTIDYFNMGGAWELREFWRDWRFIVPLVLFNSQTFLALKDGSDSCLSNLFTFCVLLMVLAGPAFGLFVLSMRFIIGDTYEFRWDWYVNLFLLLFYYLTFLSAFGYLNKWITSLDRKFKIPIRGKSKKRLDKVN